jgi:tRNA pseudouridine38-40 synthase
MNRYFLELCYDGATFGGFQIQNNVDTIQGTVQAAMKTLYREEMELTGASRTDAGVHALQNFFHFDTDLSITQKQVYNLNAILPNTIVIKAIYQVPETAHCRFDATTRSYLYKDAHTKRPFFRG